MRRLPQLSCEFVEVSIILLRMLDDSLAVRHRVSFWRSEAAVAVHGDRERTMWVAGGIVCVRHPILAKPDYLAGSGETLELVPIVADRLLHSGPNPQAQVAALRQLVIPAGG